MTPPRTFGHRLCETIHLAAAGVWLGALLISGGVAAIIFRQMRDLDPELGKFGAYTGDHATLAAGYVQNEVFKLTDVTQFAAALACLATMIVLIAFYRLPLRSLGGAVRLVSLMAALSALSYSMLVLVMRMNENLRLFYTHAEAGENDLATQYLDAFNADHPTATNVFAAITIAVFVTFVSGLWNVAGPVRREGPIGRPKAKPSQLEEPALAKGKSP